VSLDGTKVRAKRLEAQGDELRADEKSVVELEGEVKRLLAEAEGTDTAEDNRYGRGRQDEALPEELRFKQSRLAKSRKPKKRLESKRLGRG